MGYYTMYQDQHRQWRWRYTATNGKIIAVSSESYWNKADCRNGITLMQASSNSPIYES